MIMVATISKPRIGGKIVFFFISFYSLLYSFKLFQLQLLISFPAERGITWLVFCDYIRHKLGSVFRASFSKQIGAPFHLYIENETIDSIDCTLLV